LHRDDCLATTAHTSTRPTSIATTAPTIPDTRRLPSTLSLGDLERSRATITCVPVSDLLLVAPAPPIPPIPPPALLLLSGFI
jgi:hypothetical protein